ncbi:MAG TPA: hypothetical protein VMU39_01450 [Solirubrobacteraceae bacterium]|nr:hypothetical protein [Solirubrobacteraceae bacterium]
MTASAEARPDYPTPAWFVPQALCVHSGWRYSSQRPTPHARPEYRLAGRWWWRTVRVGSGEAAWDEVNAYGGGMQMLVSTFNRAAALSHGRLRAARSNADIASRSAGEQVYAAFLIVRADGDWREWPNTSRACGLR